MSELDGLIMTPWRRPTRDDHRHQWVMSREVFSSAHGAYRLIWCAVCKVAPEEGQFPIELAEEAGAVTPETVLR